jgi:ABC-type antimicrobial peptide transport system permease subunit
VTVPGSTPAGLGDTRSLANRISPDYFRTYGIAFLKGRDFDARDTAVALPVAIVNRAFADRYFAGGDPMGRTIILNKRPVTVIGMVANAKQTAVRDPAQPLVYAPFSQWMVTGIPEVRIALRVTMPVAASAVADAVRQVDSDLTIEMRSLAEDVRGSVNVERLLAYCGGLFALLAVAIGMIGTYGVFAFAVSRRRREIGVRMALGATPHRIRRLVMDEALVVMGTGLGLGLAGTWMAGRVVEGFLFQISSRDPSILAVAVLVMTVAAGAAGLPAWRASRLDPISTLREE